MNKIPNFHTHTERCGHAKGMPHDYFLQAEKDGCSSLGFSDHCPYPDGDSKSWPGSRMSVDEIPDYVNDIKNLRKKSDFPIYIGFECEWSKNYESWYRDKLLGEAGVDYLAFGPHSLIKGSEKIYTPFIDNSKDLHTYIDQTIEGMRSGLYAFVAHPDLFMAHRLTWGNDEISCFDAIIDAAEDLDLPLEVNGWGMLRPLKNTEFGARYAYPHDEFWQRVAGRKIRVICNADAHVPEYVIKGAAAARNYAEMFNLNVIDTLDL